MSNELAKKLRRASTPTEIKLWQCLRSRRFMGLKFRRQYQIGQYIVDFVCMELKLIVEIDGSQHLLQQEYDNKRSQYLNSLGFKVERFWNDTVFNQLDLVKEQLYLTVVELMKL